MKAGDLRDRVTLRRVVRTNNTGVEQRAWAVVGPPRQPAQVETGSADRLERLFAAPAGGVVEGVQAHVVTLRAPQDVRLTDQVVWHTGGAPSPPDAYQDLLSGDRVLEATAIRPAGRQDEWLLVACEERER